MSSCSHLSSFLGQSPEGSSSFLRAHAALVAPAHNAARAIAARLAKCSARDCGCVHGAGRHLNVCLHCIFMGCSDSVSRDSDNCSHIERHAKDKGHPLSLDLSYGHVFCYPCGDYVYSDEIDAMAGVSWQKCYKFLGMGSQFQAWKPSPEEIHLLKRHKKRKVTPSSTIGLRGLVNLGNTCFMSVIVQSLIHTPCLRDYFMSDKHHCVIEDGGDKEQCIVCEISRLFQEFYSGARSPLVPHVLLHMTWTHAHHLAGYEQQDAHEFFIATLDLLHRHLIRRRDVKPSNCDCIVDTIFTGKLQSDVVCQSCKNVSTTIDPFWDISLDLPQVITASGQPQQPVSLQHCLERFTKPEHLGSAAKIECAGCKSHQESTKQLTMKKLPIVMCFHLKRFEHSSRFHKKITTRVAFPEFLDMSPFVSHKRNNHTSIDTPSYETPIHRNIYTLFAVINHIGNIEAGHYTSYIRVHRDRWYRCNDHQIVPSGIEDVLASEGYLLFYQKQTLEYQ